MGQAFTTLMRLWDQSRPPKSKFNVEDIHDLTGQVMIVTGGNTGVGKETVKVRTRRLLSPYFPDANVFYRPFSNTMRKCISPRAARRKQ